MFETINYDVKDSVAYISLNRPDSLNAFTSHMNSEIRNASNRHLADEDCALHRYTW